MVLWLKKWMWELVGLLIIVVIVGTDKGFRAAFHVATGLLVIAISVDLISASIGAIFKNIKFNKTLYVEATLLIAYYIYLVSQQLIGIVYLTAAPSLILGILHYLWRSKGR